MVAEGTMDGQPLGLLILGIQKPGARDGNQIRCGLAVVMLIELYNIQ